MEHAQIRDVLGQHVRDIIAEPGNLPIEPRPYQFEALRSVANWLLDPGGTRRAYIHHATGLGKTALFAILSAAALELRVIIIVPTKVLLEQTARVVVRFTGGILGHFSSLKNIQDEHEEIIAVRGMGHSSIVLTTDDSFNAFAGEIKHSFDPHVIIRDECHWGYDPGALVALNTFPEAVVVGFSATPDYLTNSAKGGFRPVTLENGRTLYGPSDRFADTHFQTCLDRRSVKWGIENGWLCPLAWGRIEFDVKVKEIPVVNGPDGPDYDAAELQRLMAKHWSVMCETIRRLYEADEYQLGRRQVYALCPSVEAAEELAAAISSLGMSSACVSGRTPDTERNIILEAYRRNEINFVSSVMVLREGWDAPNAEVCMMLRPTRSRVLYEQSIGRALRLLDAKSGKVALVLDAHFEGQQFSPLSAPYLYGGPETEILQGDLILRRKSGGHGSGGAVERSPYLPENAKPRLVIIEDLIQESEKTEEKIRKGKFFEIDGVLWGSVRTLSKHLKISPRTLMSRIAGLEHRLLRVTIETEYYRVEEVRLACQEFLDRPRADKNGILQHQNEKWQSAESYAKTIDSTGPTVLDLVQVAGLEPLKGRDASGRSADLFKVTDLDQVCEELKLLSKVKREDGILEHEGREYAAIFSISKIFKKSRCAIEKRMVGVEVSSIEAKTKQKKPVTLFAVDEIRALCQDLLEEKPSPNPDGKMVIAKEELASPKTIAQLLGLKEYAVRNRIRNSQLNPLHGRSRSGGEAKLYRISEVAGICKDLMEKLPVSSKDLEIQHDGHTYVTTNRLEKLLGGVSRPAIIANVLSQNVNYIWGRTPTMQRVAFYNLEEAMRSFALYQNKKKKSD